MFESTSERRSVERRARRQYALTQTTKGLSHLQKGVSRFAIRRPVIATLVALSAGLLLVGLVFRRTVRRRAWA
jgi:hypothetical protein